MKVEKLNNSWYVTQDGAPFDGPHKSRDQARNAKAECERFFAQTPEEQNAEVNAKLGIIEVELNGGGEAELAADVENGPSGDDVPDEAIAAEDGPGADETVADAKAGTEQLIVKLREQDGMGVTSIARYLNESGTPTFGKSEQWRGQAVRAVLVRLGKMGERVTSAQRQDTVDLIVRLRNEGMGLPSIARHLNENGVPTFGRSSAWHAPVVRGILNRQGIQTTRKPAEAKAPKAKRQRAQADPDVMREIEERV